MNEKKSKSDFLNRIWKIRDYIQELEDVKNKIIKSLKNTKIIENNVNNIWISDVKEFY